jgi:polysaccharide export outer membrane protein
MTAVTQRTHAALIALSLLLAGSATLFASTQQSEYAVGPLDVLTITIWEQADLSGRFTVGADGNISYPLLGNVRVTGLTSRAIEELLRTRLADGYLKKPQVTVEVTQFLSQRIFMMGEVTTQGPLPLTGELTLLEALARAGGVTEKAGAELVMMRSDKGPDRLVGPLTAGAKDVSGSPA